MTRPGRLFFVDCTAIPLCFNELQAVRAIELVTERTEEADAQERVRSVEDDDDAKWAEDAVQAITG